MDLKRLRELAGVLTENTDVKKVEDVEKSKEEDNEKTDEKETTVDTKQEEEQQTVAAVTTASAVPTAPVPVGATPAPAAAPAPTTQPPQQQPVAAMSPADVVKMFFSARDQVHYYHLQTESYAEHKALNDLYDEILNVADSFMEAYQGIHGRATGEVTITLKSYTAEQVVSDIKGLMEQLKQLQTSVQQNTDLVNQLDELISVCNKTLYLLTLK